MREQGGSEQQVEHEVSIVFAKRIRAHHFTSARSFVACSYYLKGFGMKNKEKMDKLLGDRIGKPPEVTLTKGSVAVRVV